MKMSFVQFYGQLSITDDECLQIVSYAIINDNWKDVH